MSNPSNLYAEKVFAEHPIALWPIDENIDYFSFISGTKKFLTEPDYWQYTDCTLAASTKSDKPFVNEPVYVVNSSFTDSCEILGNNLVTDYLHEDFNSFAIGFYFYAETTNISSLDIGYIENEEEYAESITIEEYNKWKHISKTFSLQPYTIRNQENNPDGKILSINNDDEENPGIDSSGTSTIINYPNHGLQSGQAVKIEASYLLPEEIKPYHTYFVVLPDGEDDDPVNSFQIEEAVGSGAIFFSPPTFGSILVKIVRPISVFIRYNLSNQSSSTSYINGFSIGQWAEEFMPNSLGTTPELISGIAIDEEYYGTEISSYGLQDLPGYALSRENKLLARNNSMPIVYGSNRITSIVPENFGGPSIILPGKGFLNEDGRYKTYTFEFWLRINPETKAAKRIFGPISSSDGLYIDGPFLTVKVGDAIQAHYVGEWYRPMLIHFLVYRNGASVMINGETVIVLSFDSSSLILPEKRNLAAEDQDWVGFYSYEDIDQFQIDCPAIYSYRVPSILAKKRWIYGQAIEFPENINTAYLGKSFPIDYTFANYSNNHIYPDIAKWSGGTSENVSYKNNVLQPPEYSLPKFIFNNKSEDDWTKALKDNDFMHINLKPDESWADTSGYIYFDQPSILQQKTEGFYIVCRPKITHFSSEMLFELENPITRNYLRAKLVSETRAISEINATIFSCTNHGLTTDDIIKFSGDLPPEIDDYPTKEYFVTVIDKDSFSIKSSKEDNSFISASGLGESDELNIIFYSIEYSMSFGNGENSDQLLYKTPTITLGHSIVVGINFSVFANYFGKNVYNLIKDRRKLRLYIGGEKSFTQNTFSGNIYSVGFCTKRNINELDYLFTNRGIPFLRYQFDAGTDVSYDAQDWTGETIDSGYSYDDFIDDIIGHTASYTLTTKNFFGERYLDIATSSYWQDYVPLTYFAKKFIDYNEKESYGFDFIQYNSDVDIPNYFTQDGVMVDDVYDTSDKPIKTYISFQYISAGPTIIDDSLQTQKLSRSRTISPGTNWLNKKYEVVSGTVIYPPPGININDLAIVIHVEMKSEGIIKNPIRVRSLSLASRTLNAYSANPIGTRFGVSIFPYTKYGFYYDYKSKNEHLIYKDSTPHLYLTNHSGLELTGSFGQSNRGMALVVNKERSDNYLLAMVNFSFKFNREDIVADPVKVLEIEDNASEETIKLWIEPSYPSDRRFNLFITNKDDVRTPIAADIYMNGSQTSSSIVTKNEWNMVGIALRNPTNLSKISGRINFVGPILFNNVSYFALSATQQTQYASDPTEYPGISPQSIYQTFVGTNKILSGDPIPLDIKRYQYSVINGITSQSITTKPV